MVLIGQAGPGGLGCYDNVTQSREYVGTRGAQNGKKTAFVKKIACNLSNFLDNRQR